MKKFNKILCIVLSFIMAFSFSSFASGLTENIDANQTINFAEEKIYINASIEEDFSDSRVLIALNNDESLSFNTLESYTVLNSVDIDNVKSISDVMPHTYQLVKTKTEIKNGVATASVLNDTALIEKIEKINTDTYNRILCIELEEAGKDKVLQMIAELDKNPNILYASPDYAVYADSTVPNDTYYSSEQWAPENIGLPEAWDINTGSSTVRVGVIDSGIDITHPDLANRVNASLSKDFLTGLPDTVYTPFDGNGHGTHVAGIIGAQGNNNLGISGVCWNVELVDLRVLDAYGKGFTSDVAGAVDYAEDVGLDILNISLGHLPSDENYNQDDNEALKDAIEGYPGLIVCSAGNEKNNNDIIAHYPSNYRYTNLIAVGACDSAGAKSSYSNYGRTTVDIFAPGNEILSCFPMQQCIDGTCEDLPKHVGTHFTNGYHCFQGTSMAAPYVTGVAALLLSQQPNLSAAQLKDIIMNTAETSKKLTAYCISGGIVNAENAMTYLTTHTHINEYEDCNDLAQHKAICTICNNVVYENHTWVFSPIYPSSSISPQYIPQYECTKCGAITLTAPPSYS